MVKLGVPFLVILLSFNVACSKKDAAFSNPAPAIVADGVPAGSAGQTIGVPVTGVTEPLEAMLPNQAGPFTASALISEPQFVRRQYARGATKISVTLAVAGATPITFEEWVKMSGTSPAVKLDAPEKSAAGFYDCTSERASAPCNVHIHFRAGYHLELMGEGKARRADFDILLKGLPIRKLAELGQ